MNGIDYSKLRSLTAREIISALIRDGFDLNRTSGPSISSDEHEIFGKANNRRRSANPTTAQFREIGG